MINNNCNIFKIFK